MLINVIFSDWLTYTKEEWIQTSKIPLIYAKKLHFEIKKNLTLKKSIQTLNTLYENYDYSILNWMVDHTAVFSNHEALQIMGIDLLKFNTIYKYMVLNWLNV
jgi:hypothetical protein